MNIITTPIFYINSKPHIGHFYSLLLSDCIKKTLQLKSNNKKSIKLTTGTDEHGQKVYQSSIKENINIKDYCDKYSEIFKRNAYISKADFDDFIRTTEERHVRIVNVYWERLKSRGYIRKDKYEGYYSLSDETFIPVKDLVKKEGKENEFLTKENKQVEFVSEETFNFIVDDSLLRDYSRMIKSKRLIIDKEEEVNEYINSKLNTFSLSRPSNRVNWGVSIESSHTVYVWFDALLNYITSLVGYSNSNKYDNISFEDIKPMLLNSEFIHIIGKDITKFHCYLYPLLLLASDSFPSKMQIISHSHILIDNVKMSKSLNNSLYPEDLIKRNTYNALRYFLLSSGPLRRDISLIEEQIKKTFYTDIADSVVNLLMRLANKKLFSINDFNSKEGFEYSNTQILELIEENKKIISKIKSSYENFDFNNVCYFLHLIMLGLNNFIHHSEFWRISKINNFRQLKEIVVFALETIRIFFVLLYPILPDYSVLFLKLIGHEMMTFDLKFDYACYDYYLNCLSKEIFYVDVENIRDVYVSKI